MIYPIVAYGDPVLNKEAKDIPNDGSIDVKKLVEDMYETMYEANGVGLAAPQIGKSIRLFVVDAEPMDEETCKGFKKAFINAEIIEDIGEDVGFEEGCLSIPNIRGEVFRPEAIKMRYFDENWNEHVEEFDGMKARVIQHEYDHIEGVLFTELVSPIKRRLIRGKLENISKGKVSTDYKMKFPKASKKR